MSETQLATIDGRDALLLVLVKPGETGDGYVEIEAHCNGLDKRQAAKILMTVARKWKAEAKADHQPSEPDHTDGSEA
jgi:hypothetical protein